MAYHWKNKCSFKEQPPPPPMVVVLNTQGDCQLPELIPEKSSSNKITRKPTVRDLLREQRQTSPVTVVEVTPETKTVTIAPTVSSKVSHQSGK